MFSYVCMRACVQVYVMSQSQCPFEFSEFAFVVCARFCSIPFRYNINYHPQSTASLNYQSKTTLLIICDLELFFTNFIIFDHVDMKITTNNQKQLSNFYLFICWMKCINEFPLSLGKGVIGTSRFSYDLWGDTVNIASRIESNGVAGYVCCSQSTFEELDLSNNIEVADTRCIILKGLTEPMRVSIFFDLSIQILTFN